MFQLPNPISPDDLNEYTKLLMLSDAQVAQLKSRHAQYVAACVEGERNSIPSLRELGDQIAAASGQPVAAYSLRRCLVAMWSEQNRFREAMWSRDDKLFFDLSLLLAEEQQAALPRVQLLRQRDRRLASSLEMSKARVDLVEMLRLQELSAEELDRVADIVRLYEIEVTPLLVKADDALWDGRLATAKLELDMQFDDRGLPLNRDDPNSALRIRDATEQYKSLRHHGAKAQMAVALTNDRFIGRFEEAMTEGAGVAFRAAYFAQAYRRVHPDPTNVGDLHHAFTASPLMAADAKPTLNGLWKQHRIEYESICFKMRTEVDRRQEQYALTRSSNGALEYHSKMNLLTVERIELNERHLKKLISFSPPELIALMQKDIDAWHSRSDELRERINHPNAPYGLLD